MDKFPSADTRRNSVAGPCTCLRSQYFMSKDLLSVGTTMRCKKSYESRSTSKVYDIDSLLLNNKK